MEQNDIGYLGRELLNLARTPLNEAYVVYDEYPKSQSYIFTVKIPNVEARLTFIFLNDVINEYQNSDRSHKEQLQKKAYEFILQKAINRPIPPGEFLVTLVLL